MKNELTFSPRTIANTFNKHFANLASDLVRKLPHPTGKFGITSVRQYYKETNLGKKNLKFIKVSSVSILKILKEFKTNKAIGVDSLTGRFLKDGSSILCTPVTKICNLSIKAKKASLIFKSYLGLALSIILKQRELYDSKHVSVECKCIKI